jgi:hypothetical protein
MEAKEHINWLELYAAWLTMKSFCSHIQYAIIELEIDNTTAIACLNKKGSTKPKLLSLTKEIYEWATERELKIVASHIPGIENVEADLASRTHNNDTEWMLKHDIFGRVTAILGSPEKDLFASRINAQLEYYVAWRPDPSACHIDAFTMSWTRTFNYAFPPFSLIGRVLQKMEEEEATLILVIPLWPNRPWFPRILQRLVDHPVLLPGRCIFLPQEPEKNHPLRTMKLAACKLSGRPSLWRDFRRRLPPSYSSHGEGALKNSTTSISRDGNVFAVNGKAVYFGPL